MLFRKHLCIVRWAVLNHRDHCFRRIMLWGWRAIFLRSLFISLFESIFMSMLLTKILLLYPFVFPMLKFKLLTSMYLPMPTEISTFDNACSNTHWYLSISMPMEYSSFINTLNMSLKTCLASTAGSELPAMVDLAWTYEVGNLLEKICNRKRSYEKCFYKTSVCEELISSNEKGLSSISRI